MTEREDKTDSLYPRRKQARTRLENRLNELYILNEERKKLKWQQMENGDYESEEENESSEDEIGSDCDDMMIVKRLYLTRT